MVFDYELLDENENDENSKVMKFNSIDSEEYEEVRDDNNRSFLSLLSNKVCASYSVKF